MRDDERQQMIDFLATLGVAEEDVPESLPDASAMASDVDVVITEIGGTVGDIEGLPFVEAIRQLGLEEGMRVALQVSSALALVCSKGQPCM